MTVITKPSQLMRKPDLSRVPVVQLDVYDEECIFDEAPPTPKRRSKNPSSLFFLGVLSLLVLSAGFLCGTELYAQYKRTTRSTVLHFQRFCSIPVDARTIEDEQLIEPYYRVTPLRFYKSPDEELTTTEANEIANDTDMEALREEFEIGDSVEKISVFNGPNGRETSFIHDFHYNVSGIIDAQRCFVTGLDRQLVLPPPVFILSIEDGSSFDVSRVRDRVRVLLPPLGPLEELAPLAALAALCGPRPTYRLQREGAVIRKRSAEQLAEPAHYSQFAGRHVQDIHIGNMAELLAYEQGLKGKDGGR